MYMRVQPVQRRNRLVSLSGLGDDYESSPYDVPNDPSLDWGTWDVPDENMPSFDTPASQIATPPAASTSWWDGVSFGGITNGLTQLVNAYNSYNVNQTAAQNQTTATQLANAFKAATGQTIPIVTPQTIPATQAAAAAAANGGLSSSSMMMIGGALLAVVLLTRK